MNETELFTAIRALLADLENQISAKKGEISLLVESATVARENATEAVNAKSKADKDLAVFQQEAEETQAGLRAELAKLQGDVDALIHQKTELKRENLSLEAENKKLKEYEKTAWITLNAKDAELTQREKAVQEREARKPSAKSFLPPTQ